MKDRREIFRQGKTQGREGVPRVRRACSNAAPAEKIRRALFGLGNQDGFTAHIGLQNTSGW